MCTWIVARDFLNREESILTTYSLSGDQNCWTEWNFEGVGDQQQFKNLFKIYKNKNFF